MIAVIFASLLTISAFITSDHLVQILSTVGAAFLLILIRRKSKRLVQALFFYGLITHLAAFYWLPTTLIRFGDFPFIVAILLHLLFSFTASLQWCVVGLLYRLLSGSTSRLLFPAVWVLVDLLFPQLFPWTLAQPLISLTQLSSLAEWTGVTVLSGVLLLFAEVIYATVAEKKDMELFLSNFALGILVGCGLYLDNQAKRAVDPTVKISLIQGNLGLEEKRARDQLSTNLEVYSRLTVTPKLSGTEVFVWPETVMIEWTPTDQASVRGTKYDPSSALKAPLIYGALTYKQTGEKSYEKYNGVITVDPNGKVVGHYAKRVLMPFGEYLPFEKMFPSLRKIAPMVGDFTPGKTSSPLEINLGDRTVRVIPLICYEDLVPWLTNSGVQAGGNLLVNVTNDAWYGNTRAPYQHLLLAAWRTIETRRALIRATNTGVTAIISPRGQTISELGTFTEGVLTGEVPLGVANTFYSNVGDLPFAVALGFYLALSYLYGMLKTDKMQGW